MTDAILDITDGTTRISLINPSSGFHLVSWIPAITDYKGGGVFQNPPLADWRQLRSANWATAEENFGLHVNGANPNGVALMLQQIRQLLEKANQYWTTDWQNDPVWVGARASCETNTRYALITKGRLGNDRNYYDQPFTGKRSTMQDLPLLIERRAWQNTIPGNGNPLPNSAVESYDGRNLGNYVNGEQEFTTDRRVFISNKFNEANLTDIYFYDDSAASFGSNLMDASLPFDLIPASAANNDILYIGIDTSLADSGPFDNVIFRTSGTLTLGNLVWEYWNGSAWTTITGIRDLTNGGARPFSLDGDITISFRIDDWATTTVNGIAGYWIRLRCTSNITGTVQQVSQLIYTSTWGYTQIQGASISGDITALARIQLHIASSNTSTQLVSYGARSLDRGVDFRSYINIANEQNPTGISVSASNNTSFAANTFAPSGIVATYNPAGADTLTQRVLISFGSSIALQYAGRFRMYLRLISTGNTTTYTFEVRLRAALNYIIRTVSFEFTGNNASPLAEIDLGEFDLPPFDFSDGQTGSFNFNILIASSDGTDNLHLVDINLMPVDEWAGEFIWPEDSTQENPLVQNNFYLDVDSISLPKKVIRAPVIDESGGTIEGQYSTKANAYVQLQSNSDQRIWWRVSGRSISGGGLSWASNLAAISLESANRYLSLRGDQ